MAQRDPVRQRAHQFHVRRTNFGVLFGVMFLNHQIGAFLGAYLGGLSSDMTGDYAVAWVSLVAVGALAAIIQFSMDDRPRGDATAVT